MRTQADVLDDVLVGHHLVAHLGQRREAHVDLGLAGGADLVVLDLDRDPGLDQLEHDLGPQVLELVRRRDGEVALLEAGPVGEVGGAVGARVPDALFGIDEVVAAEGVLVEPDRVEDVELGLRAPVADVGDTGLLEVGLRLLGDVAGVAAVGLAGDRVVHVADQVHGRDAQDGVDRGRVGVREQEHVALVDGLEPADAGPVEPEAFGERRLLELADRHAEVLPGADQVDEPDVDDLHAGLTGLGQHLDGTGSGLFADFYGHGLLLGDVLVGDVWLGTNSTAS